MAARSGQKAGPGRLEQLRDGSKKLARRSGSFVAGLAITLLTAFTFFALLSYHQSDPALNTSAGGPVANWMGGLGAWVSDILLTFLGLPAGLVPGCRCRHFSCPKCSLPIHAPPGTHGSSAGALILA